MNDLHQPSARNVRFHSGTARRSGTMDMNWTRATAPDDPRQGATDKHQDDEGWKADERVRLRSTRLPLW